MGATAVGISGVGFVSILLVAPFRFFRVIAGLVSLFLVRSVDFRCFTAALVGAAECAAGYQLTFGVWLVAILLVESG